MSRLLYAGLYRLKKNKVYWSSFAVILAYGTFIYVSQYHNIRKYDFEFTLETAFFQFAMLMGVVTAVVVSMNVGTEYGDGISWCLGCPEHRYICLIFLFKQLAR